MSRNVTVGAVESQHFRALLLLQIFSDTNLPDLASLGNPAYRLIDKFLANIPTNRLHKFWRDLVTHRQVATPWEFLQACENTYYTSLLSDKLQIRFAETSLTPFATHLQLDTNSNPSFSDSRNKLLHRGAHPLLRKLGEAGTITNTNMLLFKYVQFVREQLFKSWKHFIDNVMIPLCNSGKAQEITINIYENSAYMNLQTLLLSLRTLTEAKNIDEGILQLKELSKVEVVKLPEESRQIKQKTQRQLENLEDEWYDRWYSRWYRNLIRPGLEEQHKYHDSVFQGPMKLKSLQTKIRDSAQLLIKRLTKLTGQDGVMEAIKELTNTVRTCIECMEAEYANANAQQKLEDSKNNSADNTEGDSNNKTVTLKPALTEEEKLKLRKLKARRKVKKSCGSGRGRYLLRLGIGTNIHSMFDNSSSAHSDSTAKTQQPVCR